MGRQKTLKTTSKAHQVESHVKARKKKQVKFADQLIEAAKKGTNSKVVKKKKTIQNKLLFAKKGAGLTNFADFKNVLESSMMNETPADVQKDTTKKPKPLPGKLGKKSRIALETEDLARFTIVSEHPEFQANPFEAMLNHLKSTQPTAAPVAQKRRK
jgi:hypothetical protein